MSKDLLLRLFRSEHFSDDPFLAIRYLAWVFWNLPFLMCMWEYRRRMNLHLSNLNSTLTIHCPISRRYSHHIGIHHYLSSRLREFSYADIEFYIPQLCHLLVSVSDIESVALEDFIIELCNNSPHGALIVWTPKPTSTNSEHKRGHKYTDRYHYL